MNIKQHRIAVCGASGFIGSNLCLRLTQAGHTVVPLGHGLLVSGTTALSNALSGCDTVINVAGATVDRRWSDRYKEVLYESRVGVVRQLVAAMAQQNEVSTWICVSAVGYYPSEGCCVESQKISGNDFLAELCRAWEAEALRAPEAIRTVITRFGVVMSPHEGVFARMSLPTRMGVGMVMGSGGQPFSWIDIDDLCRAVEWLLRSPLEGIFNLTAPQRVTQYEVVQLIRAHYRAPFLVHIPEWLLRLVRGEAADILVKGQCALPSRLLDAGFEFRSPDFETFLGRIS